VGAVLVTVASGFVGAAVVSHFRGGGGGPIRSDNAVGWTAVTSPVSFPILVHVEQWFWGLGIRF
jgi:hypothetical protein